MATIPTYTGPFRTSEAERLLWRAGFGPRRGQAAASLARLGLDGAVRSLTTRRANAGSALGPTTTRTVRSPRQMRTAMITSGGSTGWFAHGDRSWSE